jgi:hypothetical protein
LTLSGIRDEHTGKHISESLETIFWVKIIKFFDADPDPGIFSTLDPSIRDKHPGSATLIVGMSFSTELSFLSRYSQKIRYTIVNRNKWKKNSKF